MELSDRHPGRSANPLTKTAGLGWLEFERPHLDPIQRFAIDFGFTVEDRSAHQLILRCTNAGVPAMVIRRGERDRFLGPTFVAGSSGDLGMLAASWDVPIVAHAGGKSVQSEDPGGTPVRVVHGVPELPALTTPPSASFNTSDERPRVNTTLRPDVRPSALRRIGHVVLQTPRIRAALDWYIENLGLIVSDFQYLPSVVDKMGPSVAFLRCDHDEEPVDHHTLALILGPAADYEHSGFEVTDLDALAIGSRHLEEQGHRHAWGIGRRVHGSHLCDYWHDPDGVRFGHYTDSDCFDASVDPTWSPLTPDGNISWGPPVTKEFLGLRPSPRLIKSVVGGLVARDNDVSARYLREMSKIAKSI